LIDFVLDTSVVVSWCLKDEKDDYSDHILDHLSTRDAVVPALAPFEIANVLLVAERRGRLTEADANRFISLFDSLPIHLDQESPNKIRVRILEIGRKHRLSAYDSAYLELAMREGLHLATRDKTLRSAALKSGVPIL